MAKYTYDYYKTFNGYEIRRTDEKGLHSYLQGVRKGNYTWVCNYLYSKKYSEDVAKKHVETLNNIDGTKTRVVYVPQFYSENPWTENTWCSYFNDVSYDTLEKARKHIENYSAAHAQQRIIKRTITEEVI